MSTSMNLVDFTVLELGGALAAAVYLIATRRRSPRAATLGLAAVGLLVACTVHWPRGLWVHTAELTGAYVLLIWAVLADRPPPADDGDDSAT